MKTVEIKGVEYNIKYTLRALFVYEELKGEPYSSDRTMNNYILLYAMLMACNKDFPLSFDEVIEVCDDDPSVFKAFVSVLEEENERIRRMAEREPNKKKVRRVAKG